MLELAEQAFDLITDSNWTAQQKMDEERRAAHAENGTVIGMNRKGLIVPLPQAIVDELQTIANKTGAVRIDGELIGEVLHVFDLHIYKGNPIHDLPWFKRIRLAETLLAGFEQAAVIGTMNNGVAGVIVS